MTRAALQTLADEPGPWIGHCQELDVSGPTVSMCLKRMIENADIAKEAARGIAHNLSPESYEALKKLLPPERQNSI